MAAMTSHPRPVLATVSQTTTSTVHVRGPLPVITSNMDDEDVSQLLRDFGIRTSDDVPHHDVGEHPAFSEDECCPFDAMPSGNLWYTVPHPSFFRALGAPSDEERGDGKVFSLGQSPGSYALQAADSYVVVRLGDHFPGLSWHFECK